MQIEEKYLQPESCSVYSLTLQTATLFREVKASLQEVETFIDPVSERIKAYVLSFD